MTVAALRESRHRTGGMADVPKAAHIEGGEVAEAVAAAADA